jgi:hypothetical protein
LNDFSGAGFGFFELFSASSVMQSRKWAAKLLLDRLPRKLMSSKDEHSSSRI